MSHVIIDHHLDEDADTYRVVIGRAVEADVPKVNADGTPELDDAGAQITEREVIGHSDVEDFVFSASDPRWFTRSGKRRARKDVAAEQRAEIASALLARQATPQGPLAEATREVSAMPGIGALLAEAEGEPDS